MRLCTISTEIGVQVHKLLIRYPDVPIWFRNRIDEEEEEPTWQRYLRKRNDDSSRNNDEKENILSVTVCILFSRAAYTPNPKR